MKKLVLCMSFISVFSCFASEREVKESGAWGIREREKLDRVVDIVDSFEERVVKEYGSYYCAAARKLVQSKWVLENVIWSPYSQDLTQENLPLVGTLLALYQEGLKKCYYRLQAVSSLGTLSQKAEMLLQLTERGAVRLKTRKYACLKWFVTVGKYQAFAMVNNVTGRSS
jgi:hypothetical protein